MDEMDTFPNPNSLNQRSTKTEHTLKKRPNEIIIDQAKQKHQFLIHIGPNKIPVYFPYEPYQIQIAYMERVIESLENKHNALLQSPTGTGKTLCLLCASLGWLNYKRLQNPNGDKSKPIRILYSSRTHTQLKQVMKELKTTVYKPFCTTIGSRDHYCIKREFNNLKGTILNSSCAKARRAKKKVFQQETQNEFEEVIDNCRFYQNDNELMSYTIPKLFNPDSIKGNELMDIEDLKVHGKINKYCPYYVSMKIINDVDILFLPYNYVLEKKLREILKLSLENTVVIFDEAHNIEQIAEEGSSYELSFLNLEACLKEIDDIRELHRNVSSVNKFDTKKQKYELDMPESLKSMPEDCNLLHTPITNFKNKIQNILNFDSQYHVKEYSRDEKGVLLESKDIFTLIETLSKGNEINHFELDKKKNPYGEGWNLSNLKDYLEILHKVIDDLSFSVVFGLDKLHAFLGEIFNLWTNYIMMTQNPGKFDWDLNRINHYKLYIRNDPEDPKNILMYLWCFTPSLSFYDIMQCSVRNVILTSGTLAPFKSFETETRLDYKVALSNPHIVNTSENLLAGVFQKGPQGNVFNFSYNNRNNENIFIDMGEAFINLARQIPNGVLIIFASYQLLEKTYGIWSNAPSEISSPSKNTILKRLEDIKPIIREPKKTGMLSERMLQYVKLAKTTKGAILMAVCRGKISEGIDFSDELARAVFIVGIPFPPLYDRRVELKQRYLDTVGLNRIENKRRLTGKEWYFLQAIRAMNQSIGRVIRHKNDYGCVLFFDIRFGNSDVKKEVSGWVRDEMKVFEHFGHGLKEVLEFFKRKRQPTNAVQLNKILKVTMDNKPYTNSNINTNNGMTIIKKASNDNEEFVGLARPELKKIKTEEDRPNYQVLDSMNELMCLDFDNNQDNNHRNLQLPFLNHQENTSNFNITDNFHNNSIKINNSFENGCKNDINTDSLANFIKTERENTESSLKSEELPIKKSITVEDLKKLRSRDDLRNCALTIDSLEELETYRSFLSQREKFECMICFMNKDELFSSKCGHMACLECWKRWLKEKLVCPKCKARVREKTLIRVFNN